MRHFLMSLSALGVLVFSNCTYIPIPLPQEYKLASEAFVNTQVSEAMSAEISTMIDSMRTETSQMVGLALDSLISAQTEIREMVLANQSLQAELEKLVREQSATVSANSDRLSEMDRLVEEINILQNELIKHVESIPLVTLSTLQKAIANYRARPIQITKPEPAKIPAPVVDKKPAATAPAEPVAQEPEETLAEPESAPDSTTAEDLMDTDAADETGN